MRVLVLLFTGLVISGRSLGISHAGPPSTPPTPGAEKCSAKAQNRRQSRRGIPFPRIPLPPKRSFLHQLPSPARERVLGSARALLGLVLPTSRRNESPRSADTTRTDLSMDIAFSTQNLVNWISAQLPRFSLPALRKQTLRPGSMFWLCRLEGAGGGAETTASAEATSAPTL